jgi:hypothetical protein
MKNPTKWKIPGLSVRSESLVMSVSGYIRFFKSKKASLRANTEKSELILEEVTQQYEREALQYEGFPFQVSSRFLKVNYSQACHIRGIGSGSFPSSAHTYRSSSSDLSKK